MRSVCIIQTRMGSTRFPGKALKEVCGIPTTLQVVNRAKMSHVDEVVLAIPNTTQDDVLAGLGVPYYRGSETDVLGRYYGAALEFKAQTIIRVTADCPLVDFELIDQLLGLVGKVDYASIEGFPRGADCEMFSIEALGSAFLCANKPYQREHVTPYMIEGNWLLKKDIVSSNPRDYRYCVDEPDDLIVVERIMENLGPRCTTDQIIEFLDAHPEIVQINAHVQQKAVQ